MLTTMIAVLGTLAGGLSAAWVQARVTRTARRENRIDARCADVLNAVASLVAALADHRRAMWALETVRISGADEATVERARAVSHATRSAVTAPSVRLRILAPGLSGVAAVAIRETYAMRNAGDAHVLETARMRALDLSDALVEAASRYFAGVALDEPS